MSILQGKDVLVSLLIGYGKTFVYQLLPIAATEILHSCFLLVGDRPVLLKEVEAKRFDICLRLLARASPQSLRSRTSFSLLRRISFVPLPIHV